MGGAALQAEAEPSAVVLTATVAFAAPESRALELGHGGGGQRERADVAERREAGARGRPEHLEVAARRAAPQRLPLAHKRGVAFHLLGRATAACRPTL